MSNVFDNIQEDGAEAPVTPTVTTQKEKPVTQENTNAKIVTTLKGGSGFDAPWIVVHADNVEEAVAILRGGATEELLKATKEVSDKFNGGQAPAQQRQAPRTQGMPAGADAPRPSDPPMPEGWTYKTGVNKNGKAYRAYFPPRGSQESPQWLPN